MKATLVKLKEKITNNQKIYSFFVMAIGIVATIFVMYKVDLEDVVLKYASHRSNRDEIQMVHDFTSGMEIKQDFKCFSDFDFISINFADHDQRYAGKVGILIRDVENGETVIYEEIDMMSIYYTVPVEISFAEVGGGKANKKYEITLFSNGTGDTALGVFGYKTEENNALINGEKSEYALSFGIHSYTSLYDKITTIILLGAVIMMFLIIGVVINFKVKEENLFLLLAIPFSIGMVLLWPGNEAYDQGRHLNTVYHYSNAILGHGEQDVPTHIMMRECDIINKDEIEEFNTTTNAQAQSYYYYIDKMWEKSENKDIVLTDISDSILVIDGSFIQYTPGILGMTIARVLGCNYFWMMTLTKVAIVAFYLVLCYYAIKKIPVMKTMVAFMAALPMNLYQAAGISYDSFTFAVGIVTFSFIVKLWYDSLEKKEWIIFGTFVFLLGNCKGGVYLTLILLMIFIPKEKYMRRKWLKFGGILGVAGVSMLGAFLPTIISWFNNGLASQNGTQVATAVINAGGAVAQKLSPLFALSNPIEFIEMFVQTMIDNLDVYLGQMLGYRTAWSNQPIRLVVMLPFLILLILAVINKENEKFKVSEWSKLGILGILLFELVGMQMIFLVETAVGSRTINGFQGRYFILFLPCILLLFRNEAVVFKGEKEYLYPMFSVAQLVYWYFFLRMFMIH